MTYKKRYPLTKIIVSAALIGGLFGCSDSDDDDDPVQVTTETGVFVDSPVANIGYRTASQEGVTNASGEFNYMAGETVTFFIGDLEFPSATASAVVTPLTLAGSSDINDPQVINIARLLQTLDEDGNPDNGIAISDTASGVATQLDFTLAVEAFAASEAVQTLIANSGSSNTALVSADTAINHLSEQLQTPSITNSTSTLVLTGLWLQSADTSDADSDESSTSTGRSYTVFQITESDNNTLNYQTCAGSVRDWNKRTITITSDNTGKRVFTLPPNREEINIIGTPSVVTVIDNQNLIIESFSQIDGASSTDLSNIRAIKVRDDISTPIGTHTIGSVTQDVYCFEAGKGSGNGIGITFTGSDLFASTGNNGQGYVDVQIGSYVINSGAELSQWAFYENTLTTELEPEEESVDGAQSTVVFSSDFMSYTASSAVGSANTPVSISIDLN